MRLTLAECAEMAEGRLVGDGETTATSVSIDSRTLSEGALFVALRGEKTDGARFVGHAAEQGAVGSLVEDEAALGDAPGIVCDDALAALGRLAAAYRRRLDIPWVGVTGSNGKTTTRELLACILRTRGPVVCSRKSHNNAVGLPLTILDAPDGAWAGVVEIGANAPGEIAALCRIAMPTVGVITSIGRSHLEGLGSVQGVAEEKSALFGALPDDGMAVYPASAPYASILAESIRCFQRTFNLDEDADITALGFRQGGAGMEFDAWNTHFDIPLRGRHMAGNVLAAVAAADWLGVTPAEAAGALRKGAGAPGRLTLRRLCGVTVVDDTYNANPDSLAGAIETLADMPGERRVAVLGDMLELGEDSEEFHRECGRLAASAGIDVILAVGADAVALAEAAGVSSARTTVCHFPANGVLCLRLKELIAPGDVVLVKGSRGAHMEQIVRRLADLFPPAPEEEGDRAEMAR